MRARVVRVVPRAASQQLVKQSCEKVSQQSNLDCCEKKITYRLVFYITEPLSILSGYIKPQPVCEIYFHMQAPCIYISYSPFTTIQVGLLRRIGDIKHRPVCENEDRTTKSVCMTPFALSVASGYPLSQSVALVVQSIGSNAPPHAKKSIDPSEGSPEGPPD